LLPAIRRPLDMPSPSAILLAITGWNPAEWDTRLRAVAPRPATRNV